MRMLKRLRQLVRRPHLDHEMNEEMRGHIELQAEAYIRDGMDRAAATARAFRDFGNLPSLQDTARDERGLPKLETFLRDLRFGVRMQVRNPGFAAASLLTLALGIGATTAIFSVLYGILLRPLPFPEPDRLLSLWENDSIRKTTRERASHPDFLDIQREAKSFSSIAGSQQLNLTLTGAGEPERLQALRVTQHFFRTLGIEPILGRAFTEDELRPNSERRVILSHALWQRRFGADPAVLGRTMALDRQPHTIIGVMPRGFPDSLAPFHREDLWIPSQPVPLDEFRGVHRTLIYARLRAGVTLAGAQAEVVGILARLEKAYADDNKGRSGFVEPLQKTLTDDYRRSLQILMGAVFLVLLVAAVNVANLLFARSAARGREIAVRVALGAGRGGLLRQILTETLLMAVCGGALGIATSFATIQLLVRAAPAGIPRLETVSIDAAVLLFAIAISIGAWLIAGFLPAWRLSRANPHDALKSSGRSATAGRSGERARSLLVASEIAFAAMLVIGAGLLIKSFWKLQRTTPGYDPNGVLSLSLELPPTRYESPKRWPIHDWPVVTQLLGRMRDDVARLPGVDSVAVAVQAPLAGAWTTRVFVEGRPIPTAGDMDEAGFSPVSHEYFQTLRLPVVAGRGFESTDDARHPLVAIVSEAFVRRHFPNENPLGRRIVVYGAPRLIVGICGDTRYASVAAPAEPIMFLPFDQNPLGQATLLVRTRLDPLSLAASVSRVIHQIDPELAPFEVQSLSNGLATSIAFRRFLVFLLACFAALALALAAIGIYGVTQYVVNGRTREIGIRIALGASESHLLKEVLGTGMLRACAGLAFGALGAFLLRNFLRSTLYEVPPADPATYAAVLIFLAVVALVACWLPARRAARMEPVSALRED